MRVTRVPKSFRKSSECTPSLLIFRADQACKHNAIYIYSVYKHTFYISNRHLKDLVGSARHFGAKYLHDHKKHTIYIYTYSIACAVCGNYIGRHNEKGAAKGSACQTDVSSPTQQNSTAVKKVSGGENPTSMAFYCRNCFAAGEAKRNSSTKQIPRAITTYTQSTARTNNKTHQTTSLSKRENMHGLA